MKSQINDLIIAPCGMNCGICYAYLREKNKCAGCRNIRHAKPTSRTKCRIKRCKFFSDDKNNYCFECKEFPCKRLYLLDKRYRNRYDMSMVENLIFIKKNGIGKFLKQEESKWKCAVCGGTYCVHKKKCLKCDVHKNN